MEIKEKVIFRAKEVELLFTRKSGNISSIEYTVRSKALEHNFSIMYNGQMFEVSKVKSNDTSNLYHNEMEKAINLIKSKLL